MTSFRPRPGQTEVLAYTSGKMGISAVPGSGKTRTLAELAAKLIADRVDGDQEILVVTLVNSAVDNLRHQINDALKDRGLALTGFGFRVRTLHGLAHDIVRERPGLVGLSEDFGIIDEREANTIRDDAVDAWLRAHPDSADPFLSPELEGDRAQWVKRSQWPLLVRSVAVAFVKRAKDQQLTPEILLERLGQLPALQRRDGPRTHVPASGLALAQMGAEIYADYQRSLAYRGVVDFDDLIRLALEALKRDADFAARLQKRWPYILEDEAQDSSKLQERILELLAGDAGNWVRVGDPNQAIYDTFTTADPDLLRRFMKQSDVRPVELIQSGRSQKAIIDLANHLVSWACGQHPTPSARRALEEQFIRPTEGDDPQTNPPGDIRDIHIIDTEFTPGSELKAVADSLELWLPTHMDETVAVLAPRNQRGFELVDLLKQRGIPHIELLRSSHATRQTAGVLGNLLRCLADPTSARKLSTAFRVWRRADRKDPEAEERVKAITRRIRGCPAVESYLWPRADHDWLGSLTTELSDSEMELLVGFQQVARRWHLAASLPIDQLILTLAHDLFQAPADLALAHKLALLLREVAASNPGYRLVELVEELAVIARNERRFLGFSSEDTGFQAPQGMVTVATMHKGKGLEWDRVYLLSVNNYDFPSGQPHDTYISERWFVRDHLNLEAEALAPLDYLADLDDAEKDGSSPLGDSHPASSAEGEASRIARLQYVSERLRLLYVGITRAKKSLVITWNTGRRQTQKLQPAVPLIALHEYWTERTADERDDG
jgi:DNA helicase-2/ATP-dependent DNA helicase PcrA